MTTEVGLSVIMLATYLFVVLTPLVPSILTYKLFPKTRVGLRGTVMGFTLRAGGVFAAYLALFLLTNSMTTRMFDMLGGFSKPSWTFFADIKAYDKNGNEVKSSDVLNSATLVLKPEIHSVSSRALRVSIPGSGPETWPHVTVHIPQWGSGELDLARLSKDAVIDNFKKTVHLKEPIVVREYEGAATPYAGNQPYANAPGGSGR
jgi:hypothetical protein